MVDGIFQPSCQTHSSTWLAHISCFLTNQSQLTIFLKLAEFPADPEFHMNWHSTLFHKGCYWLLGWHFVHCLLITCKMKVESKIEHLRLFSLAIRLSTKRTHPARVLCFAICFTLFSHIQITWFPDQASTWCNANTWEWFLGNWNMIIAEIKQKEKNRHLTECHWFDGTHREQQKLTLVIFNVVWWHDKEPLKMGSFATLYWPQPRQLESCSLSRFESKSFFLVVSTLVAATSLNKILVVIVSKWFG